MAPSAVDTPFLAWAVAEREALRLRGRRRSRLVPEHETELRAEHSDGAHCNACQSIVGPELFLCRPECGVHITGQVLHVNGGRVTP